MQRLIDAWFARDREAQPRLYWARTKDGWRLALHRYEPTGKTHRTPVVLCHGMSSNRWDMDGPGSLSLARYLLGKGYDVWVVELRGAGRSMKPNWWNGKHYRWSFEDYVYHDAPALLRVVLRETRASRVHWVGHSMGGMIAYALLMTPMAEKIASAVTLGSPAMSQVGHPILDVGLPYRGLLRYFPDRVPIGTLARVAAPLAPVLARLLARQIHELGWHEGNATVSLFRKLMLTAVDDIPASLLREFARWYELRAMTDRYGMFDFAEHLERITTPILIIAGSRDGLTPVEDLRLVYERIASKDKTFLVIGKKTGASNDYAHADLILGLHAPIDVYPKIFDWLEKHRQARRGHGQVREEAKPKTVVKSSLSRKVVPLKPRRARPLR
ncbi:MAG: lysophospholipase [Candidatus Binatia bacterium]|nr:lysophospholipase [Candidatus Binatia bacterium]